MFLFLMRKASLLTSALQPISLSTIQMAKDKRKSKRPVDTYPILEMLWTTRRHRSRTAGSSPL
jgi:hypothetical protein